MKTARTMGTADMVTDIGKIAMTSGGVAPDITTLRSTHVETAYEILFV